MNQNVKYYIAVTDTGEVFQCTTSLDAAPEDWKLLSDPRRTLADDTNAPVVCDSGWYMQPISKKTIAEMQILEAQKSIPSCGRFAWYKWVIGEEPFADIKKTYLARLAYLVSMSDYDRVVRENDGSSVTPRQLSKFLDISGAEKSRFQDEMISKKYLYVDKQQRLILFSENFTRGKLRRKTMLDAQEHSEAFTRMYFPAVRALYTSEDPNAQVALKYLLKMPPFLNQTFNLLCHTPFYTDRSYIRPMAWADFCDEVGYTRVSANRLLKTLLGVRFQVDDHEEPVMVYVADAPETLPSPGIYINPRIFYAKGQETVKPVEALFHKAQGE